VSAAHQQTTAPRRLNKKQNGILMNKFKSNVYEKKVVLSVSVAVPHHF
jgi:hypothetical protein